MWASCFFSMRIGVPSSQLEASTLSASLIVLFLLSLVYTSVSSWLKYCSALSRHRKALSSEPRPKWPLPPTLPYTIPWLGHTLAFLSTKPGSFWRQLRTKTNPTTLPACALLLGGKTMHVVFSSAATKSLFHVRRGNVSHDPFNRKMTMGPLGMSREDSDRFWNHSDDVRAKREEKGIPGKKATREIYDYLSSKTSVDALTATFIECLRTRLGSDAELDDWCVVDLLSWLKGHMFQASTTALFGMRILEMNPAFAEQYWAFDDGFMDILFPIPRFFRRSLYKSRDDLLDRTAVWIGTMLEEAGLPSEEGPEWEPRFGSRVVRARHGLYERCGVSLRGRAGLDLGFLFGLSSNAIPATCWLLYHLTTSPDPTLLPCILAELATVHRANRNSEEGKDPINVDKLVTLPLLNSTFHETLRLYVDVLVVREMSADLILDSDESRWRLPKGAQVMAPSWVAHRDATFWMSWAAAPEGEEEDKSCNSSIDTEIADVEQWDARRFLRRRQDGAGMKMEKEKGNGKEKEKENNEPLFSTAGTSGRFFPFGGGAHLCPGRAFAKREVLAAVASVLLGFEMEVLGLVRTDGEDLTLSSPPPPQMTTTTTTTTGITTTTTTIKEKGKTGQQGLGIRRGYTGAGVVWLDGDVRVRLRRRKERD